jgi:hypothetical protein
MIDKAHETIPEQSSDQHFELLREYKNDYPLHLNIYREREVKLEDFLSDPDCIEVPEKVEQIMALVENTSYDGSSGGRSNPMRKPLNKLRHPHYSFDNRFSVPQISNSLNTGDRLFPSSVSEYSTLGGISLYCSRKINPSDSSSLSCSVSTFLEISGMRTAISPKRFVPLNNEYKMIVFHLPPISSIEAVTGQFIFLPDLTIIVTFSLHVF